MVLRQQRQTGGQDQCLPDIRDGAVWIAQNKTGACLGIEITAELAATVAKINARPRKAVSPYLIQDENAQPLTQCALTSRADKGRALAKVDFQFRDIQAKAATDTRRNKRTDSRPCTARRARAKLHPPPA